MMTNVIPERIKQLASITRMERGHLAIIRTGPDGQPYYNLQHRGNGRNVTEYIARDRIAAVEENIDAFERSKLLWTSMSRKFPNNPASNAKPASKKNLGRRKLRSRPAGRSPQADRRLPLRPTRRHPCRRSR